MMLNNNRSNSLEFEGIRKCSVGIQPWFNHGEFAMIKISCEASGNNSAHHFAGAGKMIEVEKRLKTATPKLELDEREAGGLLGDAVDKRKDK